MIYKRSYFWVPFKCLSYAVWQTTRVFLGTFLTRDPASYIESERQQLMGHVLDIARMKLCVNGLEHVDPNKSYLFMSNHESQWDIPLVLATIPNMLRMVSKEALFKIPIFGGLMRRTGCVPIDRKNPRKAREQLEYLKQQLKGGVSMWMAPEGTRKHGKEIGPFKKGGFHVAVDTGIPIIPILIEGTYDVTPRGKLYVNLDVPVKISFGEPIQTERDGKAGVNQLAEKVREAMLGMKST